MHLIWTKLVTMYMFLNANEIANSFTYSKHYQMEWTKKMRVLLLSSAKGDKCEDFLSNLGVIFQSNLKYSLD